MSAPLPPTPPPPPSGVPSGTALSPQQLKKALVAGGFEVFRTLPDEVVLAERVRENLILDSGVRVGSLPDGTFRVRLVLRAQRTDFPNDEEPELYQRARSLADEAVVQGFREVGTNLHTVTDPVDAERTLDTFYEVSFAREVPSLDEALAVVKFVMTLEKAAPAAPARA